jgi:hypothetical protein
MRFGSVRSSIVARDELVAEHPQFLGHAWRRARRDHDALRLDARVIPDDEPRRRFEARLAAQHDAAGQRVGFFEHALDEVIALAPHVVEHMRVVRFERVRAFDAARG